MTKLKRDKTSQDQVQSVTKPHDLEQDKPMTLEDRVRYFPNIEEWGEGEWLSEVGVSIPVLYEYKGYECYMIRSSVTGSWCGYVSVSMDTKERLGDDFLKSLDVHGGVTWYEPRLPTQTKELENQFWIGFDCSHYGDLMPRMEKVNQIIRESMPEFKAIEEKYKDIVGHWHKPTYKNMAFVRKEIESMVDTIAFHMDLGL